MSLDKRGEALFSSFVVPEDHLKSDYFGLIRKLIGLKKDEGDHWQKFLDRAYGMIRQEMVTNAAGPTSEVSFGTSGWRGKLGRDIFVKSVTQVTLAIVEMYENIEEDEKLSDLLGVENTLEAKKRGCVVGFDNRFAGELLAIQVVKILVDSGFEVQYAGESTTGVISATVLQKNCAFSINLTPSHNPLEYGGYKFNAADAGPAQTEVTEKITSNARKIVEKDAGIKPPDLWTIDDLTRQEKVHIIDSLQCWRDMVRDNEDFHGLNLERAVKEFKNRDDIIVAVDCVHGASRLHIRELFEGDNEEKLQLFRSNEDVTFGGVAPEPSSANIADVHNYLGSKEEPLKLGAIIDPDGDRIRFTDGATEISMNQFGAMAYHFLHEKKTKKGMVAKTVATSNLANSLAESFSEELYEPRVGFKNFKPVIGKAVVLFEESDGISIIGHTPEKDAYIGLLLALEMILTTNMNLGDYLRLIENEYGAYYPARDGIPVSYRGKELLEKLEKLNTYEVGATVNIGSKALKIVEIITIDGVKMIFEDGSWLMIRPSGTEPKVRFYVESRTPAGRSDLIDAAKRILREIRVMV